MRRSFSFLWQLSVLLLIAMAAGAQVDNLNQSSQSPSSAPVDMRVRPIPAR
jgi:hypothetical protein